MDDEQHLPRPKHPREGWPAWRWPGSCIIFGLCMLVYGYDLSNIANIQAPIYETMGHTELLPWIAASYTLMCVAFALAIRRLATIGDLKYHMMCYIGLILLGSAVSGAAFSLNMVIIGRCFIGLGASALYQLWVFPDELQLELRQTQIDLSRHRAQIYITRLAENPAEASRYQGVYAALWSIGLFLGPVVGGLFAENRHATWRWAIYINVPILTPMLILVPFVLPSIKLQPDVPLQHKLANLDVVGFSLHLAGCVLLLSILIYSGSTWSWQSPGTITAWVLTALIWMIYVRQQAFCYFTSPEHRYIPCDLLLNRGVVLTLLCSLTAGLVYTYTLLYMPLFFSFSRDNNAIQSGVHVLPFTGTFISATLLTGGLMPKFRYYAPSYLAGGALMLIGGALQTLITLETSTSRILGVNAILGMGVGLAFLTGNVSMVRMVPPSRAGDMIGLFITCQLGGIVLAQGVLGCVYQNAGFKFLRSSVGEHQISNENLRQLLAGAESKILHLLSSTQRQAALLAVTKILVRLDYIAVVGGGLTLALASQMKFEKLDFA